MNRTQDTIILEKIFNERLELSIYKNRGQFYLTKNLRKQFRHKIEINIDVKNQKRLIIKELDEGNVQQNFYSKKLAQHISDLVGVNGNMKFLFIRDEADNCWIGVLLPEMAGSYLWDINMCQKKENLPKDYKEEIIISIYRKFCNGVQREHNKKLNNGLPILHKVPPKRDYGRYFCIMAEKGGTSHGGLTEKLSPFFHAKKQEVNAYGR